jgi:bifunctional ADP-heptose synthase (sugar kinase/adenylyltransferase)
LGIVPLVPLRIDDSLLIVKWRIVVDNRVTTRIDFDNYYTALREAEVADLAQRYRDKLSAIAFVDYGYGCVQADIVGWFQKYFPNTPFIVDPRTIVGSGSFRNAHLKLNLTEAQQYTQLSCTNFKDLIMALLDLYSPTSITLTAGVEGMYVFTPSYGIVHYPVVDVTCVDPTGAGDVVTSVLSSWIDDILSPNQHCLYTLASYAASLSVTQMGCQSPTLSSIIHFAKESIHKIRG